MACYRRLAACILLLALGMSLGPGPAAAQEAPSPKTRPTIVEFGRETCPICKRMEEMLALIQQDYGSQVEVRILHVERHEPLYRYHRIVIIPTQIFLDASGKEVFRHEGEYSRQELVRKLRELQFIK